MTYTVTIPKLTYIGQYAPIVFSDTESGTLYKFVYLPPGGTWTYDSPVTPIGSGFLQINTQGWVGIGDQSFDATTQTMLTNRFTGQFVTLDPTQMRGFFEDHQSRLTYSYYESDVSHRASAVEWRAGISSWQEFADYVEAQFLASTPVAGQTVEQARAMFYTQWVSGLWSYGNLLDPNKPGCVTNNEITGEIPASDVTVRTFLDSPIGCCTDYAFVLAYLLTNAGIENNVVGSSTHAFNEVLIDGNRWTLDSNLALVMAGSVKDTLDIAKNIHIYRFEHAGLDPDSRVYRDSLADFMEYRLAGLQMGYSEGTYLYDFRTIVSGPSYPYGHTFLSETLTTGVAGEGFSWFDQTAVSAFNIVGDFDGDGKADLLTDHNGGVGVDVRMSTGFGLTVPSSWSSTIDIRTGNWFAADVDGDGRSDLVRGVGATVQVAFALALGGFAAPTTTLSVDPGVWGWWSGDFNGDGRADLFRMVAGVTGADMYMGSESGFVSAGSWTGAGSGSQRWYVGDFNGDGKSDIARFSSAGTEVFLAGGGSFVYAGTWTTQGQGTAGTWYVGDFNGDGKADIGRVTTGVGFEYLASTGSGFAAPVQISSSVNARSLIAGLGDFNGDGLTDVFGSNPSLQSRLTQGVSDTRDLNGLEDYLTFLFNYPMQRMTIGHFSAPLSKIAATQTWRASEIDTFEELWMTIDGQHASVVTNKTGHAFTSGLWRAVDYAQWVSGMWKPGDAVGSGADQTVFSNSVSGTLTLSQINPRTYLKSAYGSEADAASLLAAMYTREGLRNTVITAGEHTINEVYVDGGWWSINANLGVALKGRWNAVMDTATSPITHVFSIASTLGGNAVYSDISGTRIQTFLSEVATGLFYDFTRHEVTDWLGARTDAGMLLTFATLPFTSARLSNWNFTTYGSKTYVSVDMNGDGALDVFSYSATSTQAEVRLSGGAGLSNATTWLTASSGAEGWHFGDFNGDGKTDIFSLVWGVSGAYTYLSTGAGFATPTSWTPAGPGNNAWYVGDFNGDGKDDLLSYWIGISGGLVFLSDGTKFGDGASWTAAGNGTYGRWFVGDFDGDGKDDLGRFISGTGFQVTLSTGTSFGAMTTWSSTVTGPEKIEIADMNGDGRSDLVIRGTTADQYFLFLSTGSGFVQTQWSALNDETTFVSRKGVTDTFVFTSGDATITQFDLGATRDKIQISTALANSFASAMAGAEQIGSDLTLHFAHDYSITIKNMLAGSLTSDHFLFV